MHTGNYHAEADIGNLWSKTFYGLKERVMSTKILSASLSSIIYQYKFDQIRPSVSRDLVNTVTPTPILTESALKSICPRCVFGVETYWNISAFVKESAY